MSYIPNDYIQRLYAGWLGKIIGIRLGAQIEGWSYQKIKDVYGELDHYPADYINFAADDDSNGPLFFLRALDQVRPGEQLTAQHVAEALLNYAPYEHGFFWWGGYGVSTEHTAYLNLRNGIKAPHSGSVEQNGATVAEQIGGQIFIDTWGLVAPGNPDLAAKYAEQAASASHGGNGVYGGIFVATCISLAFVETDIETIIEKALAYIPKDSEYTRVVRAVMAYHKENPDCWRSCYDYIHANFGYDRYPGNCHIIPNIAVMILSMLYGKGDFSDTINICNMCGWDTDCNVGNVATIMGVLCGIDGIDTKKWIEPVHDFLVCSSCIGSLNVMDVPYGASYIAMLAYRVAGEEIPGIHKQIIENRIDSCHFEYPKSTHSLRVRAENEHLEVTLSNTDETAFTGQRSLKVHAMPISQEGGSLWVYKKTHYQPSDFHNSRYDPCFSPLAYPGQTVHGAAYIPEYSMPAYVRLYAKHQRTGEEYLGESVLLGTGEWHDMQFTIPAIEGGLIDEVGFKFEMAGQHGMWATNFCALVDDLYWEGAADYSVEFAHETVEVWTGLHKEISQFTKVKGLLYLDEGQLNVCCADFAEAYTGRYDWTDYAVEFAMTPKVGESHYANFRVQGAIRSYAFGFDGAGKLKLLKNENGYRTLAEINFDWEASKEYTLRIKAVGNRIEGSIGETKLCFTDDQFPYLKGSVGVATMNGSHCQYRAIRVMPA